MSLTADTEAALAAPRVPLALLVELDFASGPLRLWSGLGDFTWGERTFTGAGTLMGISEITSTSEQRATGYTLTLSAVPPEMVALATDAGERWQNRAARLWLVVLDDAGRTIGEPLALDAARMDTLAWEEGETATFQLAIETEAVNLTRASIRRYTAEDQRGEFPGDAAFDAVASLQGKSIRWGVADPT